MAKIRNYLFYFLFVVTNLYVIYAAEPNNDIIATARYDSFEYNYKNEIAVLSGNIEINYDGTQYFADRLYYNKNYNLVYLDGNIKYADKNGNKIYADYLDFQINAEDFVAENLKIVLPNYARFAANKTFIKSSNQTKLLLESVYTACNFCLDTDPLWSIYSSRVTIDENVGVIYAQNVLLNVRGYPVLWLPFISYPAPSITRRHGLLFPEFGKSDIANFYGQNYYIPINEHQDAIIGARAYENEGVMFLAKYSGYLKNTSFTSDGSLINSNNTGKTRWDGRLSVYNDSFNNSQINLLYEDVSDISYFRTYSYTPTSTALEYPFLNKNLQVDTFFKQAVLKSSIHSYKGVKNEDIFNKGESTGVSINSFYYTPQTEPVQLSIQTTLDSINGKSNLVELPVNDIYVNRAGARSYLTGSIKESFGITTAMVGMQGVLYAPIYNNDNANYNQKSALAQNKAFETFGYLQYAIPFVQKTKSVTNIIQPIIQISNATHLDSNTDNIYNFDNGVTITNFNNTFNVINPNTWDRILTGTNIILGAYWNSIFIDNRALGFSVAQKRYVGNEFLNQLNSANNKYQAPSSTEILQTAYFTPYKDIRLTNSSSFNANSYTFNNTTVGLNMGNSPFTIAINYSYYASIPVINQTFSQTADVAANLQITQSIRASLLMQSAIDLNGNVIPQKNTLVLTYEDECVVFSTRVFHSYYQDTNSTSYGASFSVQLKTLGGSNLEF